MQYVSSSRSGESSDGENARMREQWRRRSQPDNELPVSLGEPILLGRTEDLAVAISDLHVYSNGLAFTVTARCRGQLARGGLLLSALSRHPRPGARSVEPFLMGFEFDDGRSVSNLGSWPGVVEDEGGPWLSGGSGSGGNRSAHHDYFLSPLPTGYALTLITAWPSVGIAETRHVLDAAAIRAAAERVVSLWPSEEGDDLVDPPPPPAVPPGSWFERD